MLTTATFVNNPSFIRPWIRVNREPAKITGARLYDPELKEFVGQGLLWGGEGSRDLIREKTIESGKQGALYLFAKDRYADEFFVYHANNLDSEPSRSPARYMDKKKAFRLVLNDVNGRTFKFHLVVRNGDQSVDALKRESIRSRIRERLRRI
jgi:hypothetical protein